jgi:TolA-binding protein
MRKKISLALIVSLSMAVYSCKPAKEKLVESITNGEHKLFNDSTKTLNAAVATEVLKSYREFADKYPDDTLAAICLFKAGDLSNGMKNYKEAIEIFHQFLKKYPNHPKAPVSLFLLAFIHDNNLHDVENAKMLYSEFIQKYPDHQLAASAKASLEQLNLGLTDEQLVKMFETRDSLAKAGK